MRSTLTEPSKQLLGGRLFLQMAHVLVSNDSTARPTNSQSQLVALHAPLAVIRTSDLNGFRA